MKQFGALSNIYIILHETQLEANAGMAMRAMVNTGIKNIYLVNPCFQWPNKNVDLASAEKSSSLNIEKFADLESALSELNIVCATSARPRNMIQKTYTPALFAQQYSKLLCDNSGLKIGIMFGNEKSGLSNLDVSKSNFIIQIPSIEFSSYNLAQSVLIICYSLMSEIAKIDHPNDQPKLHIGKTHIASYQSVENFFNKIENVLEEKQYFPSEEKQISMMLTIKNVFNRSILTEQEIQSLLGVINCLYNPK